MDTTVLQHIKEQLSKNEDIAILVGKNPTLDDMAGALSLYLALKSAGKQVSIVSPTDPLVEISSLVGIDKVKNHLETTGGDLIASFPYVDGEIEKVSYTLENNFLNIIVKAGQKGLNFSEKDIIYKRGGGSGVKTVFVVGTERLSDLGNLFNVEAMKDSIVINIDNKAGNQGFGDIVMVNPNSSSVSEQVASLLSFLELNLDIDIAQNLLSGIVFATDNFANPKTTVMAFEQTADFLKKGAIRPGLNKFQTQRISSFAGVSQQSVHRPFSQNLGQQRSQAQRSNSPFGQTMQKDPFAQKDRNQFKPRPLQSFSKPNLQSQSPIAQHEEQLQTGSMTKNIPQIPPEEVEQKDDSREETPPDWLAPKVYKGSTLV